MPHLGHLGGLPVGCIAPGPYGAIALVGARLLDRYSRAADDSSRILRALADVQTLADTATKAADLRSGSRSAAGASTPTPAATGASPVSRRRSTPPTPAAADRASEPTPRSG